MTLPVSPPVTLPVPVPVRRRAVFALCAGVTMMNTAMLAASTAGSLIASDEAGPGFSGLPNAAGVLGTATGALLSGRLTARVGRRAALFRTFSTAVLGGVITVFGTLVASLPVLLAGMVLLGVGNAGAQLSRYAAAEMYPEGKQGTGLSMVVWAGTAGALAGPVVLDPAAGAAAANGLPSLSGPVVVAVLVTLAAVAFTALLPRTRSLTGTGTRPRGGFGALRRREVRVPLTAMVAAHLAMVTLMTMTPLQLHEHGHDLSTVGWVLAAHLIGMFALAPLSGKVVDRWGARTAIVAGIGVLAMAAALATAAPEAHRSGVPVAMFLLGYGWNLMFVGGSAMLGTVLAPEERAKSQGAVDALVWGGAGVASLLAGPVFGWGGYPVVAVLSGLVALVPLAVVFRRQPAAARSAS